MYYDWENRFQEHILYRGLEYADEGAVEQLRMKEDSIRATVRGSDYYTVRITLSGDEVEEMYCSCPYAAKGYSCKHMAAVLYAAEKEKDTFADSGNLAEKEITDISDLLYSASKSELVKFIKELSWDDETIENRVKVRFAKTMTAGDMRKLKGEADRIFYNHSDPYGFIDYCNASDFAREIMAFLHEKAGALVDHGLYVEAFELCTDVFVKTGNQDIDDSGEVSMICSECYDLWKSIVEHCGDTERKMIKEWFEQHCMDGTVIDYMEDVLVEFLDNELASDEEIAEQIKRLDKSINLSRGTGSCPTSYSAVGGPRTLLDERIECMRKLGASEEEIDAYRRSCWEFKEVKDYYAREAKESGDYARMIEILKESRSEQKHFYNAHKYSEKIIEGYQLLGDKEHEKAERILDFKAMKGNSLDCFRRIRELCTELCTEEEWLKVRDELIRCVELQERKCELLAEEKLYDELYRCLFEYEEIALLNKYGSMLTEKYSAPILEVYETYVKKLAETACNRSRYDELTEYLSRMRAYEGGEVLVSDLAREWMAAYPTRKVMIRELSAFIQ